MYLPVLPFHQWPELLNVWCWELSGLQAQRIKDMLIEAWINADVIHMALFSVWIEGMANIFLRIRYVFGLECNSDKASASLSFDVHRIPFAFLVAPRN